MDPHFETLASTIADAVTKRLELRFEKLERLEPRLAQLEQLEPRLAQLDGLEERLTAHVDKQLAGAVAELKHHAQMHKEELKEDVKKAAEGYDATLRKIERELADLNAKVDTGFRDHDLILKDHSERIVKLEQKTSLT